jgi:uncharacterized protein (DUF1330 family)
MIAILSIPSAMIVITQLIYINEGQQKTFDEFESVAIPLIAKYNGRMLLRVRPAKESIIEANAETPYEIHLVEFDAEEDLTAFMKDETRRSFLHLKERAIKSAVLVVGRRM